MKTSQRTFRNFVCFSMASFLLLISAASFLPNHVAALSCIAPAEGRQSLSRAIDEADYLFEGKVVSEKIESQEKSIWGDTTIYFYTIQIDKSYKGKVAGSTVVRGGGLCGMRLSRDTTWLIYGSKDGEDTTLGVDTKPLADANEDIELLQEKGYHPNQNGDIGPLTFRQIALGVVVLGTLPLVYLIFRK